MPTGVQVGVQVKLLGWIKSAVDFVRSPASPRKDEPPPQAPPPVDSHTVPEDVNTDVADTIQAEEIETVTVDIDEPESRPQSPIDVAPESQISVESEIPTSVEPASPTVVESEGPPSQEEIDRRRGMVRAFFNDYWSSTDEKPASFAERLDRAESYINERVAAGGEAWRLGPATRKQLGLPPSKKR
jgi:hypothetical protein